MPIIQVEMLEGRTIEQKRQMVKKVTEAVVDSVHCPPEAVRVIIREMPKEHFAVAGKLIIDEN
ncbi:MAG TPA: 4-oxalocrotonate tautomerase [Firmicutes bacterium]|nr:4-oxalocrotonate tautomerase [Bacillota bacterium]